MKNIILSFLLLGLSCKMFSQEKQSKPVSKELITEALNEIITDLQQNYIYLKDKNVDLNCIKTHYKDKIKALKTEDDVVLFFEYLLDEFYDSHLILNTNCKSSFRLYAPIHSVTQNGKTIINSVWQTQIKNLNQNIIGAEILKFNGKKLSLLLDQFPTTCNNKNNAEVRTWIGNKILAGRYNEPRNLELKLQNGSMFHLNLDSLKITSNKTLLSTSRIDDIGIIKINNSLGNSDLITAFDKALDSLTDTKGLIVDLRNTVDGGDSYIARGIMGRFIDKDMPYQKHWTVEDYSNHPSISRSWIEYVSPRGIQYKKPVVILVGRWTGSMGEGLAIGFEGMGRGEIVGTEMEQLAGAMNGFGFKNLNFGYRLSTEKLFHINGTPREKYIPTHYIVPVNINKDEILEKGINIINKGI